MSKVLVAMSGGVDSSVAASLLLEQGYEVVGFFMQRGRTEPSETAQCSDPETAQGCGNLKDEQDVRRVAEHLGIRLDVVNFDDSFGGIIEYFIDEYLTGRTPNPCIVCNMRLKFGRIFEHADQIGADYLATGHYARIVRSCAGDDGASSTDAALCRGLDPGKDQAYSLFGIRRDRLPRILFPIGEHHKSDIRNMAMQLKLPIAEKPDSQEICFVPDDDHSRFIREHRPGIDMSGQIVTTDGRVVGQHDGIERFTVGQRRGLGVAMGRPFFVQRIEPQDCRVVIGERAELACDDLIAEKANWLIDTPHEPFRCRVKIRYRSEPVDATVDPQGPDRFQVRFDEPCLGVAPGQAAVCFQDDRVLGGGFIVSSEQ